MDKVAQKFYPTPLVNAALFPLLLLSLTRQRYTPKTAKSFNTEYDYIVVGAGSAGSVVASRLSEKSCVSVLLLEAGKAPPLYSEIPGTARLLWFTKVDWKYRTVPQKYTGNQLKNRRVVWPSGKALGGSSILNGMLYVRGNRKDYDEWAAEGADGWSYKDVFPYFLKMEDNRDPKFVADGYHNVGGPQTIHQPRYQPEIKAPIFQAAKSMGYRIVDPNGARQTGFYDVQGFMRSGQRCSTAKAYLVPAENRTNLDILPKARVRRVVIKNHRAVGVEFDFQGQTYVVKARREVIMSAGTINSAQLLMLSGIGPRKELERHGIPVIADLPVGQNLQDHCGVNVNFELSPKIDPLIIKLLNPINVAQYMKYRTGILSSTELITIMAFLKRGYENPIKDVPDFQLYFLELTTEIAFQIGIKLKAFGQVYSPYAGKPLYACATHALKPRSRGTVTLNSADPYDMPLIDPNYFADPRDVNDTVEGLKVCNRIGMSPEMRNIGSTPFRTLMPGCEQFAGNEDKYLRCLVAATGFTLSHQVGTARMGNPNDPRTVVDPLLRVKYIKGLRVVDASIMPLIPRGNTNAPTIMVGEKASDIIKSTIKCPGEVHHEEHWSETDELTEDDNTDELSEDDNTDELTEDDYPYNHHRHPSYDSDAYKGYDDEDGLWKNSDVENKKKKDTMLKFSSENREIANARPWNKEFMLSVDSSGMTNISNIDLKNVFPSSSNQPRLNRSPNIASQTKIIVNSALSSPFGHDTHPESQLNITHEVNQFLKQISRYHSHPNIPVQTSMPSGHNAQARNTLLRVPKKNADLFAGELVLGGKRSMKPKQSASRKRVTHRNNVLLYPSRSTVQ